MRTYEEIESDIKESVSQWDDFENNPESYVLNEYGTPQELVDADLALMDELMEMFGTSEGSTKWAEIVNKTRFGLIPDPEINQD